MVNQDLVIRAVEVQDVPAMADLWHEKIVLQQQSDRRYRLAPDSKERWSAAVRQWKVDPCYVIYVAESECAIVGYIIAHVQSSPPGLVPDQMGIISDLAVGVHSYKSGLGRHLLKPTLEWFGGQNIERIVVNVPHRQPVEQAFWRAIGATEWVDLMWMTL